MNIWELGRVPSKFWSSIENQRDFLEWLAKKYNVSCLDDWYKVPSRAYPIRLLKIYNNYHSRILATHFPEHKWLEWKFVRTPHNFWASLENRRRYINWLGSELGYSKLEDWYKITGDDFRNNYGESLLVRYYKNSYQRAVVEIFSEFDWQEWRFESVSDGFWNKPENRRRFMAWLGERLGYNSVQDWYSLTHEILTQNKGYGIYYKLGSISAVVKEQFPFEDIHEWQFQSCSRGFWKKKSNRRRYMDWLQKKLGYIRLEDWYKVTAQEFHDNYGGGLLNAYYDSSPSVALIDIYPDFQWNEWLFVSAPQSFWYKNENRRRYLDWLGKKLGHTKFEDWYNITVNDFQRNNGVGFLNYHGSSPSKAVTDNFHEYDWDISKFFNRPQAYWQDSYNRSEFLKHLFSLLGYRSLNDWYRTSHEDFTHNGGSALLKYYGGSHVMAIIDNYPGQDWLEWEFNYVPQGFWDNPDNRKRYLVWLGKKLGYSIKDDWYKINTKAFEKYYGSGMLQRSFGGSPSRAVMEIFPEQKWFVWMFRVCMQNIG